MGTSRLHIVVMVIRRARRGSDERRHAAKGAPGWICVGVWVDCELVLHPISYRRSATFSKEAVLSGWADAGRK